MPTAGRIPTMTETNLSFEPVQARTALDLMVQALDLIDANDGPGDAGCYLDHAIHRLRDWIESRSH